MGAQTCLNIFLFGFSGLGDSQVLLESPDLVALIVLDEFDRPAFLILPGVEKFGLFLSEEDRLFSVHLRCLNLQADKANQMLYLTDLLT